MKEKNLRKNKRKFSKDNKEKRINTIIEIRKEILVMLRDLGKDLDRELYNSEERKKINREVKEIAEMIRDKHKYMEKAENLEKISKSEMYVNDDLIRETRKKVNALLKLKVDNMTIGKYDQEEREIILSEIEDAKHLVYEKDRLIQVPIEEDVKNGKKVAEKNNYINKHLKSFFKMDTNPEL